MYLSTPSTRPHSVRLFNRRAIDQLVAETSNTVVPQILTLFSSETKKHQRHIQTAIANKDSFSLAQEVHSLKSSAQLVGAERLYQVAFQIEQDCKRGNMTTAFSLSEQLPRLIDKSLAALHKNCF